jgi:hypothetical protein
MTHDTPAEIPVHWFLKTPLQELVLLDALRLDKQSVGEFPVEDRPLT